MVEEILEAGKRIGVSSAHFGFPVIVNETQKALELTLIHDDIMRPVIIIRDAPVKTDEDMLTKKLLKQFEGQEIDS